MATKKDKEDVFETAKPAHGADNGEALKILEQEAKEEDNA